MPKKKEEEVVEEVVVEEAPKKKTKKDLKITTSVNSDIREINEALGRC